MLVRHGAENSQCLALRNLPRHFPIRDRADNKEDNLGGGASLPWLPRAAVLVAERPNDIRKVFRIPRVKT